VPKPLEPVLAELRAAVLDPELVRAVAAGRRKGERPTYRRAELRWVEIKAVRRLQLVRYSDTQAFTENLSGEEASGVVDALLAEPYGNWHVVTGAGTVQVRVTKSGEAVVHRSSESDVRPDLSHDRTKSRLLDPGDEMFHALGITDAHGQVKPSRRDKYHQVEEFVRALEPVMEPVREAADDGELRVADLGCGNAYLSFAAYRWLARESPVRLTGVDVKEAARKRNTRIARELGWSGQIDFVAGEIGSADVPPPHLAMALHACDTATDDALARAVEWETPVIMAAPCCHHDIQRQLRESGVVPEPYGPLARHGILRERFADVLTDALRALVLRLAGYRVSVIEFVASAHTPRNTLIRAVRTGARPTPDLIAEYRALTEAWQIHPALAARLPGMTTLSR
jgi:SAM-dependent methyltransferase